MSGNFDTTILRTFVAVAQSTSLAQAATRIGRSQPSISQHLMRLEDIVKKRLIDRGPRGAKLTKDGEAFLSYALRILSLTDEAIERFQPQQFKGRIAIGVIEDFAYGVLSDALIDFMKMHADLDMEVIVADSQSMHDKLVSGQLDLALGDPFYLGDFTVWRTPMELRWYADSKFDIKQSPLPLIMFSNPCRWREPTLEGLDSADIRWRIVYESSSLQAIHAAASAGLGMACCLEKAKPPGTQDISNHAMIPSAPIVEVGMGIQEGRHSDPAVIYLSNLVHTILVGRETTP